MVETNQKGPVELLEKYKKYEYSLWKSRSEKARGKGLTFPGDAPEPTNATPPTPKVEGKGVDVASEKKSGLFIGVIGLEGDNYSGEFVGGGLDEVEAGNFGEIVFDEL